MANGKRLSRRAFALALPWLLVAARHRPRRHGHEHRAVGHPEPRPGITGEKVLSGDALKDARAKTRKIYDMAREIPEIADGIYCYCNCTAMGHRSLLSCFESTQAIGCMGCRDIMEEAYKLAKDGKTLAEIRIELDKIFA